ncbi:MAG: F0F1 ATP synthase subunit delta [Gammaproteobacteria bacterium]|uniref:F0F1 ATP synthase subunit delta n=1 Tax=Algiphilus sp. TaxID=1872431 RepID=UPI0032F04233
MQEKLTIARPYAAAAYAYADEHGEVEQWSAMLGALASAVSDPLLARCIGHPKVSDADLLGLLEEVLGERLNDTRRNFLVTLIEAERLEVAPQVAEVFERRRAKAAGVVHVDVTSAFALNGAERDRIEQAVKSRLGSQCEIAASVDPELIGGAVIKIGDSVIDLSLRGRLAALEQQLG